jgi:teichuronic acid biosynthesis glycosyltransferase TuaC
MIDVAPVLKTAAVSTADSPAVTNGSGARRRILSLCCLYPNPLTPTQGVFVQRRLEHMARLAEIRVVAPFAIAQYGNPGGSNFRIGERRCPLRRNDVQPAVWHPRWFYPPLSGSLTPFWLFSRLLPMLWRMRREFPFEIIDTHFGFPEGITGALLATALRVPFTMTLRGNEPKHSRGRLGRFWMSWALRRAGRVFAVSERLRQFAVDLGARPQHTVVIPNGVDSAVFFPRDLAECRRKYDFAHDRPLIVSAGALVERKGHHRVVHALAGIQRAGLRPQLAIAGGPGPEGSYTGDIRRAVSDLGLQADVRFLGALPAGALAEVMSAADIFCLASSNEGWPNVVHEALACGLPVVATDVGAIPEMLAGGSRGIVVPVNDPAALRAALQGALERSWNRHKIALWARSRGWDQVAGEVVDCMQQLVSSGSNTRTRG